MCKSHVLGMKLSMWVMTPAIAFWNKPSKELVEQVLGCTEFLLDALEVVEAMLADTVILSLALDSEGNARYSKVSKFNSANGVNLLSTGILYWGK